MGSTDKPLLQEPAQLKKRHPVNCTRSLMDTGFNTVSPAVVFPVVLIGWIFSLCLHEFSHAVIAYRGGDHSVREKGYLSFNPLRYINPQMSIIMPRSFCLSPA